MNASFIKKIMPLIAICGLIAITGCSKSPEPMPKGSGFLPNYALLKPIPSPKDTQIYLYKNPEAKRSNYTSVMVSPVALYQTATKDGVTIAEINAARAHLNENINNTISKIIPVTATPGAGVAVLSVAITGATVAEAGFQPWNVIPISAAIKLASMATDLDSKTPALVIELKFTDSVSGALLLESVAVITGDSFHNRANTSKEFVQLAKTKVAESLQYSLNQR